jgi:two-component system, LytTR family, response regulator
MKLRTLIVDDEMLARERLHSFLEREPDVELCGEAENGGQAVEMIQQQKPDLVFLDIQMPELDGFGVVSAVGPDRMPPVIFVTAHDRFALRAFEVHALDYLLKPFDRERFQKALERARQELSRRGGGDLTSRLTSLLAEVREKEAPRTMERLAIKTEGKVLLFRTEDIDWIEAADNYVNIHVGAESHLHRETLSSLEARLPPEKFIRISRSVIVHVERIKELQPMFHGDYVVILRNNTRLNLSRNFRERLSELLGKGI